MKPRIKISLLIGIATLSLLFQNCSKVSFDDNSNGNNDGAGVIDEGTDTDIPITQDPSWKYPKLKIEPQACIAGNVCEVQITALEPVEKDIAAYWQTNDAAWEYQPAFYAKPNVHYVPATGHFKIEAGKSSTIIKVTSINWENKTDSVITFSIPLTVSQCKFANVSTPCSLFF